MQTIIFIDCFWVSKALKGHGYSNDLLNECIKDAQSKDKIGLCILSSKKKIPFLSDSKYSSKKGFREADESDCGIYLTYLPFDGNSHIPKINTQAKHPSIQENNVLFKTVHINPKKGTASSYAMHNLRTVLRWKMDYE